MKDPQIATGSQFSGSSGKSLESLPTSTGASFTELTNESHADRKRKYEDTPVITGEEDESNVLQVSWQYDH